MCNMSEAIGRSSEPTKNWFYCFLGRIPMLKIIYTKKHEEARDDALNEETLTPI